MYARGCKQDNTKGWVCACIATDIVIYLYQCVNKCVP